MGHGKLDISNEWHCCWYKRSETNTIESWPSTLAISELKARLFAERFLWRWNWQLKYHIIDGVWLHSLQRWVLKYWYIYLLLAWVSKAVAGSKTVLVCCFSPVSSKKQRDCNLPMYSKVPTMFKFSMRRSSFGREGGLIWGSWIWSTYKCSKLGEGVWFQVAQSAVYTVVLS